LRKPPVSRDGTITNLPSLANRWRLPDFIYGGRRSERLAAVQVRFHPREAGVNAMLQFRMGKQPEPIGTEGVRYQRPNEGRVYPVAEHLGEDIQVTDLWDARRRTTFDSTSLVLTGPGNRTETPMPRLANSCSSPSQREMTPAFMAA